MADFFNGVWTRLVGSDTLITFGLTILISLFAYIFTNWLRPKVKLRYGNLVDLVLLPKNEDGTPGALRVRRTIIANFGTKAADDIEITLNWVPEHLEQYPHLATSDEVKADGRLIIRAPRLNAGESFWLSMTARHGEIPPIIYIRGKDARARPIEYNNIIWYSPPIRWLIGLLLILGCFSSVYIIVIFLGWLLFGRIPSI